MKKIKLIFCVCVLVFMSVGISFSIAAEKTPDAPDLSSAKWFESDLADDAYVFPDFNGEKYAKVSYTAKIALCQIPDEILESMSTKGLVESCLSYPFFFDMVFRENPYSGYENIANTFNGIGELLSRDDCAWELYSLLKGLDFETVMASDESYSLRMRYFSYMISQQEVLEKLTKTQRADLVALCNQAIYFSTEKYPDTFASDPFLLIAGRTLLVDSVAFSDYTAKNTKVSDFLEKGILRDITDDELNDLLTKIGYTDQKN